MLCVLVPAVACAYTIENGAPTTYVITVIDNGYNVSGTIKGGQIVVTP